MPVGPNLDDLARRNVPVMPPGAAVQVAAPTQESLLDRVMRLDDEELARDSIRGTLELRDLERQAKAAKLQAEIDKTRAQGGQTEDGAPAGGGGGDPLIATVFGFFAKQNTDLQAALQSRDSEVAAATREELKGLREQMTAIASGGTGGIGAQLQVLREAIKFQTEFAADLREAAPHQPAAPAGVTKVTDIIAYEDAMTRREHDKMQFDLERDKWRDEMADSRRSLQLASQRMGFVMQLANRHLPEFMGAITGRITGQIPPPPPPPPPNLAPGAPAMAGSQAPAPPPIGVEQLILTECPTCHRRFGVAPGATEAVCAYADCPSNGERLELTPITAEEPAAPSMGTAFPYAASPDREEE